MASDNRLCRNLILDGARTCLRMECAFWAMVDHICTREEISLAQFCQRVRRDVFEVGDANSLTSAIRVYVAEYFHAAATEEGHKRAGHKTVGFPQTRRPVAEGQKRQKPTRMGVGFVRRGN